MSVNDVFILHIYPEAECVSSSSSFCQARSVLQRSWFQVPHWLGFVSSLPYGSLNSNLHLINCKTTLSSLAWVQIYDFSCFCRDFSFYLVSSALHLNRCQLYFILFYSRKFQDIWSSLSLKMEVSCRFLVSQDWQWFLKQITSYSFTHLTNINSPHILRAVLEATCGYVLVVPVPKVTGELNRARQLCMGFLTEPKRVCQTMRFQRTTK